MIQNINNPPLLQLCHAWNSYVEDKRGLVLIGVLYHGILVLQKFTLHSLYINSVQHCLHLFPLSSLEYKSLWCNVCTEKAILLP